jgi:hypothetical protein
MISRRPAGRIDMPFGRVHLHFRPALGERCAGLSGVSSALICSAAERFLWSATVCGHSRPEVDL